MDVKKLRELMGLTQQELADRVGVTLRTIQNWESGKPLPERAQRLLVLLADQHENGQNDPEGTPDEGNPCIRPRKNRRPVFTTDMQRFFETLTQQQELMSRQLDELALTRQLIQKKDEQIDMLLKLIQAKQ